MAINLLSLANQFITPDMISRLASSLGLDRSVVGKLVTAGLPSIMAGLGGVAATPNGAKNLADIIGAQDEDALQKLTGAIGGAGQSQILAQGGQMLSGLIGGKGFDALAGALGSHAGADASAAKSVLGFLSPAVMGVIGQQDPSAWADGGGVTKLFADQKSAVAAAIPSNLATALGATGILSSLGNLGQGAAASATNAANNASAAARNTMASATGAAQQASGGIPGWLWVVGALVLAGLGWLYFGQGKEAVKQAVTTTTEQAAKSAGAVANSAATTATNAANSATTAAANSVSGATTAVNTAVNGIADAAKSATSSVTGITSILQSITDPASATAALPKLKEAAGNVDKLAALSATLPADARKTIAAPVAGALPTLRVLIEKLLAMPGVGDVIKPAIDPILATLDTIAKG